MTADQNPGSDRGFFSNPEIGKVIRRMLGRNVSGSFSTQLGQVVDEATYLGKKQVDQAKKDHQQVRIARENYIRELRDRYAQEQDAFSNQAAEALQMFGVKSKLDQIREKVWNYYGKVETTFSTYSNVNIYGNDENLKVRQILTGYCLYDEYKGLVLISDPENNVTEHIKMGSTHLEVNIDFAPTSTNVKETHSMTGVDSVAYIAEHAPFLIGSSYDEPPAAYVKSKYDKDRIGIGIFAVSTRDPHGIDKLDEWLLEESRSRISRALLPRDLRKHGKDQINKRG